MEPRSPSRFAIGRVDPCSNRVVPLTPRDGSVPLDLRSDPSTAPQLVDFGIDLKLEAQYRQDRVLKRSVPPGAYPALPAELDVPSPERTSRSGHP